MLKSLVDKSADLDEAIIVQFPRIALDQMRAIGKEHVSIQVKPLYDIESRFFRVTINGVEYASTLVDLPTIIEAHKTKDYKTLFKGGDICQLLFVHSPIPGLPLHEFDPFMHDHTFLNILVDPNSPNKFKCKSGLAPGTTNVATTRHKPKLPVPEEDIESVEKSLKQIIDTGFSENVDEELLHFDAKTGELLEDYKGAPYHDISDDNDEEELDPNEDEGMIQ